MYLTICFAFEKPRWLLHNTADRAETVFIVRAGLGDNAYFTSVSVGPPNASGWNWAVNIGFSVCMMPYKC